MESTIHTFTYTNNEIQKVQQVKLDNWQQLNFFTPKYSFEAFKRLASLYQDFIVKKYSFIFGQLVLFTLPDEVEIPFKDFDQCSGKIYNPLTAVAIAFRNNCYLKNKEICFKDETTADFFKLLKDKGCLKIAQGKRNSLTFLPVGKTIGLMSEDYKDKKLKVNSNFFVFDKLDCVSEYDVIGTPIGLMIKDGKVTSAPLFNRDSLLVDKNGYVTIKNIDLKDITIKVDNIRYQHDNNACFFTRDTNAKTIKGGTDIICVNNKVVALKQGGDSNVPCGGFIIHSYNEIQEIKDLNVYYEGFENINFGLQVGNSSIVDGKPVTKFTSKFYNFLNFYQPSFPPSMYPLNYNKARAPRIVLGSDADNKPVILWFEGAGKFGYEVGKESCGASLKETAQICQQLGLINGIHLDGGGSAAILLDNKRQLKVSDRDPVTFAEIERAIASGLYID